VTAAVLAVQTSFVQRGRAQAIAATNPASPPSNEGAPPLSFDPAPVVVEVVVHAPQRFLLPQLSLLLGQIAIKRGDRLSRVAVRDAIERLFASGEFADVVVSEAPRPGGVALIFDLPPQKRLTTFTFQGASALTVPELTAVAMGALQDPGRASRAVSLPVPYFPEQLEQMREALQLAYQRRGYQSAKVSARAEDENESEVSVTFSIDEGVPTRIASLAATGEVRLSPDELQAALGLQLGQIADAATVSAAVERLERRYQKDHYYQAQVGQVRAVPLGDGEQAQLMVPVEAGPQIRFHFHGNAHFDSRTLRAHLGFSPEDRLDETEQERMAARVRSFYLLNGFFDAKVVPEEVWSPDHARLVIIFDVDEGLPLRVARVEFEGNHHFDDAFLVERVHESLREAVPDPDEAAESLEQGELALPASDSRSTAAAFRPTPETVFAEPPYKDALARIVDLYKADGYLEVNVDLPRLEIDERNRTAVVHVPVVEGPRTFVSGLRVEGIVQDEPLVHLATLKLGSPFNAVEEENTRLAIARKLQQEGYLFARVVDAELFTPDHTQVNVVYKVTPGPLVHVRSVIVRGNEHTRESVIRSGLALQPGDLFDQEKVDLSERNLLALGIFSRVEVRPLDLDHEAAAKDLVVEVDERARTDIVASLGGSLVDGPRAYLEANRANLFGLGLEATLQAKVNYFNLSYPVLGLGLLQAEPGLAGFGGHVDLGLRDSRIFAFQPQQVSAHLDLVAERINRPAYQFTREAALLGFDWQVSRWFSASLLNTVESDDVNHQQNLSDVISVLSQADLVNLRFAEGVTPLYSFTPGVTFDFRDNSANPHSGFLVQASAELTRSLGGTLVSYVKPQLTASVYLPLGKRATLALSARMGRVYKLDPGSTTIAPKRFFLGGTNSMRGYPEDSMPAEDDRPVLEQQVDACNRLVNAVGCSETANILRQGHTLVSGGGDAFVLYKAELRFPIVGNFEGAVFVDAGNLWDAPEHATLSPTALRFNPGVGLRYATPVGPLALDVGMNAVPDTKLNETVFSLSYVQFSIGLF